MEKVVSVTHLKASLSAYLHQVKSGEEILIFERGKAIARLVPYVPGQESDQEEQRLQRLYREGIMKPGNGKSISEFLKTCRPAKSNASVVQALLEERESGW